MNQLPNLDHVLLGRATRVRLDKESCSNRTNIGANRLLRFELVQVGDPFAGGNTTSIPSRGVRVESKEFSSLVSTTYLLVSETMAGIRTPSWPRGLDLAQPRG